jgi:O-methyltransferase involved in polyketide biosynthesis
MGAGLDARSLRLLPMLRPNVRLFEVDSPGSSREKQAMLHRHGWLAGTQANVSYIAQDFEKEPLSTLPEKLACAGLQRDQPTLRHPPFWRGS